MKGKHVLIQNSFPSVQAQKKVERRDFEKMQRVGRKNEEARKGRLP